MVFVFRGYLSRANISKRRNAARIHHMGNCSTLMPRLNNVFLPQGHLLHNRVAFAKLCVIENECF